MRFVETGTDIPDELIRAVAAGSAIFLCGAGVSCRVDLPLFGPLTDLVYAELGEQIDAEPAEKRAFERKEFDRALRSLEKRTHRPRSESRVRAAVAKHLAVPTRDLPDHTALLHLSRDMEGRPRLLTTNFDTLFERAAKAAGFVDFTSSYGKSLPRPGGNDDHGILHLHGRISDDELGLGKSDLVLTSADFGDAYLRNGWASRYIEDRMRLGPIVLIGYAAEDVAMRLLLETLDADRDRFRDLGDVYAMEVVSDGSASIWNAKGIKPIEFQSYDALYATVQEWARYAQKPTDYATDRISTIFRGVA